MRQAAIVLFAALGALLALISPAFAATAVFFDTRGETPGRHADITRVGVSNGTAFDRVVVRATVGRLRFGDVSHLWLSTNPESPGPEFRMTVIPNSDGILLHRMGDEFWGPVSLVDCPGLRARSDAYGGAADDPDHVRFSIPRPCLNDPGAIQLAVRHKFTPASGEFVDWAPRFRKFFPSVASG